MNRTNIPCDFDHGLGTRARIGIIQLATDQTSEHEFRQVMNRPGVATYASRIYNATTITPETLKALEGEVEKGTSLILPGLRLDVVGFCCTSGAVIIGDDQVASLIRKVRPGISYSSPMAGAIAGMKAVGLRRVAMLTPYVQEINDRMRAYIEARGVSVPIMGSFSIADDAKVAVISERATRDAAIALAREAPVDGVFVSCTSIRTLGIIEEVEAALGKPMVSSNQGMAWHMLRLGGIKDEISGFGKLLRTQLG
ncbi:MAG: Asp/Glu racemase [Alphaproteobacteria bacterium]|nr:Asp/Glu racemase [Alphaproteobacteria bacterium]